MRISIIVAMDKKGVIGADGGLPWRLPADLKYFRAITMGKPIIMGRKTHESIGRPLPGRLNIVMSRDARFSTEGCTVVASLEAALHHARAAEEVMIIGGAAIYRLALPIAHRIYLTEVGTEIDGDVRFPDTLSEGWREVRREERSADQKNRYPLSFVVFERVSDNNFYKSIS